MEYLCALYISWVSNYIWNILLFWISFYFVSKWLSYLRTKRNNWELRLAYRCVLMRCSFGKPDLSQVSWPALSSWSLTTFLSIIFPILLSTVQGIRVRCQFEFVFSKDFKNLVQFIIWINFCFEEEVNEKKILL